MNKQYRFHCAAMALGLVAVCSISPRAADDERLVVSGFEKPESVVHDPILDVHLASNVGSGNPAALDQRGFISRVSPTGVVLELAWIRNGVHDVTLNGRVRSPGRRRVALGVAQTRSQPKGASHA